MALLYQHYLSPLVNDSMNYIMLSGTPWDPTVSPAHQAAASVPSVGTFERTGWEFAQVRFVDLGVNIQQDKIL